MGRDETSSRKVIKCWEKFCFVFFRTNKRKKWKTIFPPLFALTQRSFSFELSLLFVFATSRAKTLTFLLQLRYSNVFEIAERWRKSLALMENINCRRGFLSSFGNKLQCLLIQCTTNLQSDLHRSKCYFLLLFIQFCALFVSQLH
jgi:hypothetical protein